MSRNESAAARLPVWVLPFGVFALASMVGSQIIGFTTSPPEVGMGHLQKILYVHVPAAWNAFIAYFVVFVASVLYLWKRKPEHDLLAASAAEAGTVLIALALGLGMIWAKPTWGTWWEWDPRLVLTAVQLLLFVGYLALRAFTEDEERRARWSAGVGILGALNVPIVYMSVRWWRTIHQIQSTPETMDSPYKLGMRINAFAFLFLLIFFIALRYHTAKLARATELAEEERAYSEPGAVHV
ncbi:MAG: cytochrome c biogenesis protein CcsA [Gemmatimonadetes bacterium]|nr:cytochrome c biogenesis protein CcsA [Gemmatimonadota bacterium]